MSHDPQPTATDRKERPLFGTLLDSKPTRTRSPGALAAAVVVHLVFFALLVVLSQRFIPIVVDQLRIGEVEPVEVPIIITLGRPSNAAPTAPQRRAERDQPAMPQAPELVFTPGPITEIPPSLPGPETPEPADTRAGEGNAARSLSERLRPQTFDPRLSPSARYIPGGDGSPAAGVRERVALSIQEYNDSVAAENDAKRRALDWTIKTKDGKQWGIGPDGRIHLGDITLPKVAFSPPPGRRDEINNRVRDWNEIERQANQEIGRQSFKERVKAIRARKEREREEKKKEKVEDITN